jgi:hypothetical protein
MIGRRDFITLLGGAAAAWPLAARAQQPDRMRQIGVLMGWPESDPEARLERAAFVQELQKLGWLDGRNLRIDTRWANPADPESMHRYAKDSSRYSQTSFFRTALQPLPRRLKKLVPFPSFSGLLLIRSAAASSRASRAQAATLPGRSASPYRTSCSRPLTR